MRLTRTTSLGFRRVGGFTLLEILVAMTIVALVLVAMNTFVFSMGELWGRNSDVRLFELHVRNVTRFLEHELRSAALPPAIKTDQEGMVIKEVKPKSGSTEEMLTFELPAGCRLITWPERPLPDVVCALSVRSREGLLLLWQSKLDKNFDKDSPREAVITPLATGLSYDYYDTDFKTWKNEAQLKKGTDGKSMVPQRLRLQFTYGTLKRESVIALPTAAEGLPLL